MSIIGSPFPLPPVDPMKALEAVRKLIGGIGKVAKYTWDLITGEDEKQTEIANQKSVNPQKSTVDEMAELNKLLTEYRNNISSAAEKMEREMIVECSMMLEDIMDVFTESNQHLKVMRSDSVERKFKRVAKDLKGTFAEYVQKRISLDDAECVKILKLPAGELKNQRLQEMKQRVFVEASNEIVKRIKDAVEDFSDTVEDAFNDHLDRAEEQLQERTESFEELSRITENDTESVENVMLKANYLLAVCSYVEDTFYN